MEFKANSLPLFKNILTPGGMESTPALIASNATSSGVGLGVHLGILEYETLLLSKWRHARHHHETVLSRGYC